MEDWTWFLSASINIAFSFSSQLQSNRKLSLCPEGRMSVFMMFPTTCQLGGRRLEGGRLNLMRILIAVTQSLLWPPQTLRVSCPPYSPIPISALPFSFSSLPCGHAASPVQKRGPRPLPGAEWKCQRLLNPRLFFLPLQLGTLFQQVRKWFFFRLYNKECDKFGKKWDSHLHPVLSTIHRAWRHFHVLVLRGKASRRQMTAAVGPLGYAGSLWAFRLSSALPETHRWLFKQ